MWPLRAAETVQPRNPGHEKPPRTLFIQNKVMEFVVRHDGIVAVGLLTEAEVELLGVDFDRLWPVDQAPCFDDLLRAIDEADRQLRRSRPRS